MDKEKNTISTLEKTWRCFDTSLNALNHLLITFITVYVLILAFTYEKCDLFEIHIICATIGYQFFMAHSILSVSKVNLPTRLLNKDYKKIVHLIFGIVGIVLGVVAVVVIVCDRKRHFYTLHGLLGLAAVVFIVPSIFNGPILFVLQYVNRKVKPIYMKIYHTVTASMAFVCGLACLCTGYEKKWFRRQVPEEMVPCFIVLTSITIVLTLKDPIINIVQTVRGMFRK